MEDIADSRKRSHGNDNSTADTKRSHFSGGDEPLLKLTVPIYVVGALLGKGGTHLNELKEQYGGNIRISASKEFYPGTDERIVVLTGTEEQILNLSKHIMEKLENPGRDDTLKRVTVDEKRAQKTKIVLTNNAAGLLIGKGGNTIKGIQTESKAYLSIVGSGEGTVPFERVLTITAENLDDRVEACQRVLDVIAKDASNMSNTQLKYVTSNVKDSRIDPESLERQLFDSISEKLDKGGAAAGGNRRLKPNVEVSVEIPGALVGGVLGKQGSVVKDLSQRSGAKFQFAEKGTEKNSSRQLTITGNMDQAYSAFNLVNERVEFLESQQQNQMHQQQYPESENIMNTYYRQQYQAPCQNMPYELGEY